MHLSQIEKEKWTVQSSDMLENMFKEYGLEFSLETGNMD